MHGMPAETHWRALSAVEAASGRAEPRPAAAYFVHVPYAHPEREAGYVELANAVAALIARLVEVESSSRQLE